MATLTPQSLPEPLDPGSMHVESRASSVLMSSNIEEVIADEKHSVVQIPVNPIPGETKALPRRFWDTVRTRSSGLGHIGKKLLFFVGPGAMVSVSYIDPGNYSTGISAGASFRYDLLCVVLIANILAIFLQSLCLRLGTVTGRDLAQNSRERFPRWLNIIGYLFAEAAILCTDLAEVIGTAIALNMLSHGRIPLVAGVALTMTDVVIILFFYNRSGSSMFRTQVFELGITSLVIGVAVCFAVELSKIHGVSVGDVFHGFLPSKTMVHSNGLYVSCGILGATVMPHSLFLGSGLVQTRLRDYDIRNGFYTPSPYSKNNQSASLASVDRPTTLEIEKEEAKYRPSLAAIRDSLPYSLAELAIALGTFALFINSSIIIVSGSTLYNTPDGANADLFSIYDLLKRQLSTAAATVFALALLLSGQSAGLVVTLSGQIVSEGYLRWNITPWVRRLITRTISVIPCIIVASAFGRSGISSVLNASQVALSIILPFVTAPLVWFTCRKDVMSIDGPDDSLVETLDVIPYTTTATIATATTTDAISPAIPNSVTPAVNSSAIEQGERGLKKVDFSNSLFVAILAVAAWVFIAGLNAYLIVSLAMHKT